MLSDSGVYHDDDDEEDEEDGEDEEGEVELDGDEEEGGNEKDFQGRGGKSEGRLLLSALQRRREGLAETLVDDLEAQRKVSK